MCVECYLQWCNVRANTCPLNCMDGDNKHRVKKLYFCDPVTGEKIPGKEPIDVQHQEIQSDDSDPSSDEQEAAGAAAAAGASASVPLPDEETRRCLAEIYAYRPDGKGAWRWARTVGFGPNRTRTLMYHHSYRGGSSSTVKVKWEDAEGSPYPDTRHLVHWFYAVGSKVYVEIEGDEQTLPGTVIASRPATPEEVRSKYLKRPVPRIYKVKAIFTDEVHEVLPDKLQPAAKCDHCSTDFSNDRTVESIRCSIPFCRNMECWPICARLPFRLDSAPKPEHWCCASCSSVPKGGRMGDSGRQLWKEAKEDEQASIRRWNELDWDSRVPPTRPRACPGCSTKLTGVSQEVADSHLKGCAERTSFREHVIRGYKSGIREVEQRFQAEIDRKRREQEDEELARRLSERDEQEAQNRRARRQREEQLSQQLLQEAQLGPGLFRSGTYPGARPAAAAAAAGAAGAAAGSHQEAPGALFPRRSHSDLTGFRPGPGPAAGAAAAAAGARPHWVADCVGTRAPPSVPGSGDAAAGGIPAGAAAAAAAAAPAPQNRRDLYREMVTRMQQRSQLAGAPDWQWPQCLRLLGFDQMTKHTAALLLNNDFGYSPSEAAELAQELQDNSLLLGGEQKGQCPVCQAYYSMDVLAQHASRCGE